ncbi:MAG TPA: glutathione S-transferase family protein [Polyangiaceae bacterium]|nr:glutathione S-transferase family protein [Polyangiaceae bacterium]
MALTLFSHPLASYCWKALIALYENETPFTAELVDLNDERARKAFYELTPLGKFPLLRDDSNGRLVPESTIIIEYLSRHYPGRTALIPQDADAALEARLQDRFFDQQLHEPMQKHVLDKLRPEGQRDAYGVQQAHEQIERAYAILQGVLADRSWAAASTFTLADCAAAPALYYCNLVHPLGAAHGRVREYLKRLEARPSFARVLEEAQPFFKYFPG